MITSIFGMPLQNVIFLVVAFAFLIYLIVGMIKKTKEMPYSQVRVKKVDSCFKEGLISLAECDGDKKVVRLKYKKR